MSVAPKSVNDTNDDTNKVNESAFPPEAYAFDDDVTSEAVEELKKRASKVIDAEEWKTLDGFGQVVKK